MTDQEKIATLIAALEKAERCLHYGYQNDMDDEHIAETNAAMEQAQAALRLAKGAP